MSSVSDVGAAQNNNSRITGAAEFDGKEISCIKKQDLEKLTASISISDEQKELFNTEIEKRSAEKTNYLKGSYFAKEIPQIKNFENKQTDTEAVLREFYALNPNSPKEDISGGPINAFGEALQCGGQAAGDVMKFGEHGTEIQFVKIPDPTLKSGCCYQLVISGQLENCLEDIGKMYSMLADPNNKDAKGALIDLKTGKVELNGQTFFLPPGDGTGLKEPNERSREAFAHMQDRSQNCPDVDILGNSGLQKAYQDAFSKFKNPDSIITSDIKLLMNAYTCVCKDRWELKPPPPPPAAIEPVDPPKPKPPAGPLGEAIDAIMKKIDDLASGKIGSRNDMINFRSNYFKGVQSCLGDIERSIETPQDIKDAIDVICNKESINSTEYNKEEYASAIKKVKDYLQKHGEIKDHEEISEFLTGWGNLIEKWDDIAKTRGTGYRADFAIQADKRAQSRELVDLENLKAEFEKVGTEGLKLNKFNKVFAKTQFNAASGRAKLYDKAKDLLQKIPVGGEDANLQNAIDILVSKNPLESGEATKDEFQGARDAVLEHLKAHEEDVPGNTDRHAVVESWSNIMLGLFED